MKKTIIAICLLSAVLCPLISGAQTLVFTNQTITVEADQLSIETVRYYPEAVVTNQTPEWVDVLQITTNGFFAGGGVVTNAAQAQQVVETVITNAAHWVANVRFELPAGHQWQLNAYPVTIERFRTNIEVVVDPAQVTAVFGEAAAGLQFAATYGKYQPEGPVRDAFLSIAAATLYSGGSQ